MKLRPGFETGTPRSPRSWRPGWEGWTTNRLNPPVLILGERHGIELGLRQQRRAVPLQVTDVDGLLVPTAPEMLRDEAFLTAERRATRDYVDWPR